MSESRHVVHIDPVINLMNLELPEFEALVEPVPIGILRDILKRTAEGRGIQRTLLRGFRPDSVPRSMLVRAFYRRISDMRSFALAAEVIAAWEAIPGVHELSVALLGRPDALHGTLTPEFIQHARAAIPQRALSIAAAVAGGGTGLDTSVPIGDESEQDTNAAEPLTDVGLVLAEAGTAEDSGSLSRLDRPVESSEALQLPLFSSVVDRDVWAWREGRTEIVGDDDRLLELSEFLDHDSGDLNDETALRFAESTAARLDDAGARGQAASYWLAAFTYARRTQERDSHLHTLGSKFLAARLGSAGSTMRADSVDDLVAHAIGSSNAGVQREGLVGLVTLASIDSDTALEMLSRKVRESLAQSLPIAFLEHRRKIDEQRGQEPALHVLARERSRARLALESNTAAFMAAPTQETIRRSRGAAISGAQALRPFVAAGEQPSLDKLCRLLGRDFSRYEEAAQESPADDELAAFRLTASDAVKVAVESGGHDAIGLVLPFASSLDAALVKHHQAQILGQIAHPSVRVVKPAHLDGGDWAFQLEFANAGPGSASELVATVTLSDDDSARQDLHIARLAPSTDCILTCALPVSDRSREIIEVDVLVHYGDGRGRGELRSTIEVRRGRDVDLAAHRALSPYTIRSISDPSRLKGRSEQLSRLREGVQRGSSFTVTGQRRVGKTSLVKVFLSELEKTPTVLGLHLSLGEISASAATPDLGRLGRDLCERLAETYETRYGKRLGIDVPSVSEFRDGFNSALAGFLRRFHQANRDLSLAFAIDDFDELPTALFSGDAGKQFFLALRALMDKGTCFLFIGSERLPSLIAEQAERLNQVEMLPLDYLDLPSMSALVREPTAGLLDFDDEAVDRIADWSARNPYFATILCTRLWESAVRDSDPTVSRRDVDDAARNLTETSPRSFYQHFWSDSRYLHEDDRAVERSKAFLLLFHLVQQQDAGPFQFVDRSTLVRSVPEMTSREAYVELTTLIQRGVVEVGPGDAVVRVRVPLFAAWLRKNGEIESAGAFSAAAGRPAKTAELTSEEVNGVARDLEYRGRRITTDEVRLWVKQFGGLDDQRLMLRLLGPIADLGLFRLQTYNAALRALDAEVRGEAVRRGLPTEIGRGRRALNYFVTHADESGKSGSALVTSYRRENHYMDASAGGPQKVLAALPSVGPVVLICVDDFVGTGRSAVAGLEENIISGLDDTRPDWRKDVFLVYAGVVGFEAGLETIRASLGPDIYVCCAHPLSDSDRAFDPDNGLFDYAERERAKELAHRFGALLEKKHPLGYENSQALVAFYDTVPNNTLPILHKSGSIGEREWEPLFPRL